MRYDAGFTLVELLVVMVLTLLITGGILTNYNSFNENQRLKQTALTLKNNLRLAQQKAASAVKPSGCVTLDGYVVSYAQSSYTIQAQCNGAVTNTDQISVTLPQGITFSPVPGNIFFVVLRGSTYPSVTITLQGLTRQYRLQVNIGGDVVDSGYL